MFKFNDLLPTNKYYAGVNNTCEYIMLHHTGGGSYKGNCKVLSGDMDNKKTVEVSCHFVIGSKGEICKIGDPTNCLRHAGVGSLNSITDMNFHALGIEVVGPPFTKFQLERLNELVRYLAKTFKIPMSNIIRHKDYAPRRKVDIDDSFYLQQGYKTFAEWKAFIKTFIIK